MTWFWMRLLRVYKCHNLVLLHLTSTSKNDISSFISTFLVNWIFEWILVIYLRKSLSFSLPCPQITKQSSTYVNPVLTSITLFLRPFLLNAFVKQETIKSNRTLVSVNQPIVEPDRLKMLSIPFSETSRRQTSFTYTTTDDSRKSRNQLKQ